jgi:hypothetical protein
MENTYHGRVMEPAEAHVPRPTHVTVAAALMLALFAGLAIHSMAGKSCTSDEVTHLPSGYTYLATGDRRLNRQHPPLLKMLAAAPLLALDPQLDLEDPGWTAIPPDEWGFGRRFLYGNDADRLLFWGRMPTVLLGVLLGIYLFVWARALWGPWGALISLGLYASCPTVLGHARWVTMDVGLACFYFVTFFHLWAYLRRGHFGHLLGASLGIGLAMVAKFSGAFTGPVAAVLVGLWVARPFEGTAGGPDEWPRRALSAVVGLGAMALVAGIVVWAAYGFPPRPSAYLEGLTRVNADHDPEYAFYLLGQFREGGWWWYFLAAAVFKVRVPVLALMVVANLKLRHTLREALDEAFLLLPPLVFFFATSALAANVGIRYILPVLPFLFLWIGRLGAGWRGGVPRWVFAGAMALWCLSATLRIHPHHLSYFNGLAGGPEFGYRVLDDSNIDWGQDLPALKRTMDELGVARVILLYPWIVSGAPEHYGIDYELISEEAWQSPHPPPGVYAISTNMLIRGELTALETGVATDWLQRHTPIARAGYSFYLFRFE